MIELEYRWLCAPLAAELQEPFGNDSSSLRRPFDFFHVDASGAFGRQGIEPNVSTTTNAHQEIAEIVSHTTRECAQSFQFPGMTQLHCPASIFYLGFASRRHIRNQSNAVPRFTGIAVDPSENALPQRNRPASGR